MSEHSTSQDILKYIPQRPPFVMVDKIYEQGTDSLLTGFNIQEENVLVYDGHLNEGGLVENIAQTAAIFAGLQFKAKGKGTPLGYIASIRNLEVFNLPKCNSEIKTTVRLKSDLSNIHVVEGEIVNQENEKLASCELRIFIKAEE